MMLKSTTASAPSQIKSFNCPGRDKSRFSTFWKCRSPNDPTVERRTVDRTSIDICVDSTSIDRRMVLAGSLVLFGTSLLRVTDALADDFVETSSGLKYLDIKIGSGQEPSQGSKCAIHWSGYTEGYQGKRFGNSTIKDEPFEFVLGKNEAIPAIEEAVTGMKVGGIRRIQIPGIHPEIGYPRDRGQRFVTSEANIYKYRLGPQPPDLGGQRALDFVLDNPTLQPFNRDLLMDIKLLRVSR